MSQSPQRLYRPLTGPRGMHHGGIMVRLWSQAATGDLSSTPAESPVIYSHQVIHIRCCSSGLISSDTTPGTATGVPCAGVPSGFVTALAHTVECDIQYPLSWHDANPETQNAEHERSVPNSKVRGAVWGWGFAAAVQLTLLSFAV